MTAPIIGLLVLTAVVGAGVGGSAAVYLLSRVVGNPFW